jgi:hypothetical protein
MNDKTLYSPYDVSRFPFFRTQLQSNSNLFLVKGVRKSFSTPLRLFKISDIAHDRLSPLLNLIFGSKEPDQTRDNPPPFNGVVKTRISLAVLGANSDRKSMLNGHYLTGQSCHQFCIDHINMKGTV